MGGAFARSRWRLTRLPLGAHGVDNRGGSRRSRRTTRRRSSVASLLSRICSSGL